MNKDFHPFKRIQIVEDLCKILNEKPKSKAFELVKKSNLTDGDWEGYLYFIQFLATHLKLLSSTPFDQLNFIRMIEMLSDKNSCFEYQNFEVFQHYIDGVIFIDDLNDFLEEELEININYHIN